METLVLGIVLLVIGAVLIGAPIPLDPQARGLLKLAGWILAIIGLILIIIAVASLAGSEADEEIDFVLAPALWLIRHRLAAIGKRLRLA